MLSLILMVLLSVGVPGIGGASSEDAAPNPQAEQEFRDAFDTLRQHHAQNDTEGMMEAMGKVEHLLRKGHRGPADVDLLGRIFAAPGPLPASDAEAGQDRAKMQALQLKIQSLILIAHLSPERGQELAKTVRHGALSPLRYVAGQILEPQPAPAAELQLVMRDITADQLPELYAALLRVEDVSVRVSALQALSEAARTQKLLTDRLLEVLREAYDRENGTPVKLAIATAMISLDLEHSDVRSWLERISKAAGEPVVVRNLAESALEAATTHHQP